MTRDGHPSYARGRLRCWKCGRRDVRLDGEAYRLLRIVRFDPCTRPLDEAYIHPWCRTTEQVSPHELAKAAKA